MPDGEGPWQPCQGILGFVGSRRERQDGAREVMWVKEVRAAGPWTVRLVPPTPRGAVKNWKVAEASLAVQWLGHCTSVQRAQGRSLIGDLRFDKLHGPVQ